MTRQNNLIQSSYCQCLYDCDKSTIDGVYIVSYQYQISWNQHIANSNMKIEMYLLRV
jgi:hypothetical protein